MPYELTLLGDGGGAGLRALQTRAAIALTCEAECEPFTG